MNAAPSTPAHVTLPELALPKGGGAIHGLNETVNTVGMTGMASVAIPFPVSAGRSLTPSLALTYSSGSGNGPFGLGWSLLIPRIGRRTAQGVPAYQDEDEWVGPDGEALVPEVDSHGQPLVITVAQYGDLPLGESFRVIRFFPRIESHFDRIERWTPTSLPGPGFWLMHGADGSLHLFGKTAQARLADPAAPDTRIADWLLEESLSPTGEHLYYEYQAENDAGLIAADKQRDHAAQRYLKRVRYGNLSWAKHLYLFGSPPRLPDRWHFELVLDYGERALTADIPPAYEATGPWPLRQDAFSHYAIGFEVRTHRLCRQVLMFHDFPELGDQPVLVNRLVFEYDENPFVTRLRSVQRMGYDPHGSAALPPVEFAYSDFRLGASQFRRCDTLPSLHDGQRYQLVDLYGEGLPGVLYRDETSWLYRAPIRAQANSQQANAISYGAWRPLPSAPAGQSKAQPMLTDLTGDGQLDWVMTQPGLAGFFTQRPDKTWSAFVPFAAFPTEFLHPHAQLANLMGAGLTDLALIGPRSVRLYANRRANGFAPPMEIAHEADDLPLPALDANEVVALSDVLGSGQPHLVRIRHNELVCWPNLGRGRFGRSMKLAALPFEARAFDPQRVLLADLDGSGAADLIYAQSDRLLIFRNQSGHRFSQPEDLLFPAGLCYDALCQLSLADMEGCGCASLILTVLHPEPHHWRYDFTQGVKPYLLTRLINHLGSATEWTYRSSAQEWLDEKQACADAVSHLPFPVHVVSTVRQHDEITGNTLTQRFQYRHGVYDGRERELNGFGLVLHTDTEAPPAGATDTDTLSAPVLTKTWYHTGLSASSTDRRKYARCDAQAIVLGGPLFRCLDARGQDSDIDALDAATQAEMTRALKGSLLRVEVCDPASEATPYTVAESRYLVRLIQARGQQRYAVVLPFLLEQLNYHYECTPTDPIVTHHITLAWDRYGAPTHAVALSYPRRNGSSPFQDEMATKWWQASQDDAQKILWLHETRQTWFHLDQPHAWRLALPEESRSYALQFEGVDAPQSYESLRQANSLLDGAQPRVLTGYSVMHYASGQDGPPTLEGLVDHIESAELDANALTAYDGIAALQGALLESALTQQGYTKISVACPNGLSSPLWTVKSNLCGYAPPEQFRQLIRYEAAPGVGATQIQYDAYQCQVIAITDAVNNRTQAQYDYRRQALIQLTDPNGNVQEAAYDALGRLRATSFYGHENGQPVGFAPLSDDLRMLMTLEGALQNPKEALGKAATVHYYNAFSWHDHKIPIHSTTLMADRYPGDTETQIRIALEYTDGFGRVLQSKQQVDAGPAYSRDELGNLALIDGQPIEKETSIRWTVSGRVEYNNKGLPVRTYQPYFIDTYQYVNDVSFRQFGYGETHYYDPLDRKVKTVTAQGYLRRQVHCTWYTIQEDENDTMADMLTRPKVDVTAGELMTSPGENSDGI